jgi:putative membrane protein
VFLETKVTKIIYVSCVTLFLTSLGWWALLAHQDSALARGRPRQTISDEQFARNAAQGGLAEVKLGQLAQERGSSQAVRDFGEHMVAQHSRANDQLKQVALQAKLDLLAELSPRDQSMYDALCKLSGREFDRAYARDMVEDHVADLAEFQREANAGQNEGVKVFASQSLAMLREHLNEARGMLKRMSASSAKARWSRAPGATRTAR